MRCIAESPKRFLLALSRRAIAGESGTSTVELAIVAPVFILLLFGIIEFGAAYSFEGRMYDAARQTVRLLALGKPIAGGPEAYVRDLLQLAEGEATVTPQVDDCGSANEAVSLTVQVPASVALPTDALGMFGGGSLQAMVTMRREDCPTP